MSLRNPSAVQLTESSAAFATNLMRGWCENFLVIECPKLFCGSDTTARVRCIGSRPYLNFRAHHRGATNVPGGFGIGRENSGQCNRRNRGLESIQIKAILNRSLKSF